MLRKKLFALDQVGMVAKALEPISFSTDPSRYKHWKLTFEGNVARLILDVQESIPLRPGNVLKLNSYDLGVDLELRDAIDRIRFEHPEVRSVVITSAKDRIFSAGANIGSLATSSHGFKVNFCKFTNETRLYMEETSERSGIRFLAACNGTTAGGGYELAMACDEIALIDDGSSVVSLPEVGVLAVLPGTGGLTRLVDKRKVRRDLADRFSTLSDQGAKAKRAVEWGLVDVAVPRSKWTETVRARAQALAEKPFDGPVREGQGITLDVIEPTVSTNRLEYKYVTVSFDPEKRTAELVMRAPDQSEPATVDEFLSRGSATWALRAFRELDDALLRLRFNHEEIGVVALKTEGDIDAIKKVDQALSANKDNWLVNEIVLNMGRVLRRLDMTAKSFFAVIEPGSCFAGPLLELALAADQVWALDDSQVKVAIGSLNSGALPMWNGLSRVATRFYGHPDKAQAVLAQSSILGAQEADGLGLVTVLRDNIDFADELRVAIEERAALSPDALTGLEANLRFPGPQTLAVKIFTVLSAWQNWIFTRGNATGPAGALTRYGHPERPKFNWKRT